MQTTLSPVVLFVYNRLEHTRNVLYSINRLKEAPLSKLYIFSDQAKNEKAQASVNEVRVFIRNFVENESNFAEVEVRSANRNKGLANSIIDGVTEIINHHGKVIVLEDDLVVSNDFLQYMNEALQFYENKQDIWSISGYSFPLVATKGYPHDVFMCGRGCSWGWATWIDRWNTVDWEVKDYPKFKFNLHERHLFNRWGKDLSCMLDAQQYGETQSWAIRWCYSAFRQNKMTVYPVLSRVVNFGTDGSGTNFNSSSTSKYDVQLYSGTEKIVFDEPKVDEKIRREFSGFYLGAYENIKLIIRWALIKLKILQPKRGKK